MKSKLHAVLVPPADAEALRPFLDELRKAGMRPTRLVLVELNDAPRPQRERARQRRARVEQNHQSEVVQAVVQAWCCLFKYRATTAAEALRLSWELSSQEARSLDLALRDIARDSGHPLTPRHLAHWLGAHTKHFVRSGFRDHTSLWRLRETSTR